MFFNSVLLGKSNKALAFFKTKHPASNRSPAWCLVERGEGRGGVLLAERVVDDQGSLRGGRGEQIVALLVFDPHGVAGVGAVEKATLEPQFFSDVHHPDLAVGRDLPVNIRPAHHGAGGVLVAPVTHLDIMRETVDENHMDGNPRQVRATAGESEGEQDELEHGFYSFWGTINCVRSDTIDRGGLGMPISRL